MPFQKVRMGRMRVKRARRAGQDAPTSFRRSIRGHDENAMALRMGGKSGCRVVAQTGTECHAEEKCQRRRRTPAGEGSEVQKAGRGESSREAFSFAALDPVSARTKARLPHRQSGMLRMQAGFTCRRKPARSLRHSSCSQAGSRPWSTDTQRVFGLMRRHIHRIPAFGFAHVDARERSPHHQSGMLRM